MTDPESRPIRTPEDDAPALFAYQFQYPLGILQAVTAHNMSEN